MGNMKTVNREDVTIPALDTDPESDFGVLIPILDPYLLLESYDQHIQHILIKISMSSSKLR